MTEAALSGAWPNGSAQLVPRNHRPTTTAAVAAPEMDQFAITAKIVVKLGAIGAPPGGGSAASGSQMLLNSVDSAVPPGNVNSLRAAIVAGELAGSQIAIDRLVQLEAGSHGPPAPPETASTDKPTDTAPESLPPASDAARSDAEQNSSAQPPTGAGVAASVEPDLSGDIAVLREIYAGRRDQLTQEQRDALVTKHGWFGKLALSHGLPETDPLRASVMSGQGTLVAVFTLIFIVGTIAIFGGLTCGAIAIAMLATGRVRPAFRAPMPGGSVYLELLVCFVAGFILLKVGSGLVAAAGTAGGQPSAALEAGVMLAQWVLVITLFWPLLRGATGRSHRMAMGWHAGKGVAREIGSGIFGYLAGLPLLFVAAVITIVIMYLKMLSSMAGGGPPAPPPKNPILDFFSGANPLLMALLFMLATMWAPIVEEGVFRGAAYRHLRSRLPILPAAMITAVAFGLMHGYDIVLLLPVMTLGFNFALLREWRGSLIAPMTAHCMHNATIMSIIIPLVLVLRD